MNHRHARKKINIKRALLLCVILAQLSFALSAIFVSFFSNIKASSLYKWSENQALNSFMYALQMENRYFTQEFQKQGNSPRFSSIFFSLITNIHLNDIRTLMRDQLPGFSNYYSQIIVAGEGTDETNIPYESNIPLKELLKQRQVDTSSLPPESPSPPVNENKQKIAFIYHSHNRESFLPLLPGTTDPNAASSDKVNVSVLGERLAAKLEEQGIGATNNKTDIVKMLLARGLNYVSSYNVSREVVTEALNQNRDIKYLIDIHRDSSRKPATTKIINGKAYGRLYFVVGRENKHYEENLKFIKAINAYLDKHYYGISRGIFLKDRREGNGVYNQDLSPTSMLVEIGGVDNTLDELYRTVDILAEAISDYHKQAEKVSNPQ
ncbi:MAG: stage II sporulation protein P [Ectobacillus sp.]